MRFLDIIELNPTVPFQKGKHYPFVEMANVDFYMRSPKQIDYKPFTSGVKFEKDDTVISRIEPCLQNGKGFYVNEFLQGFGSTEYLVFRPKNENLDSRYLYYFMQSSSIRKIMIASMSGSTGRQRVNNEVFERLDVPIIPLPTQRCIAEILSAYDDLIENNQKQIKLLEEAAMLLYKEWFVRLRFPGHENVKIVDSLPEGWRKGTVKDFGEIITGKTPSTTITENFNGSIPFVKIPDMHNAIFPLTTEMTLSTKGTASQHNKSLPIGSVLVSCIATVGLVCITYAICQTNQQINSIVPSNPDDRFYLYCVMKGLKNILLGIGSSGATMTNVNKTKFEHLPIMIPEQSVLTVFTGLCEPLFGKIFTCQQQIQQAKIARDKLLPKLMNGEIEV